MFEDLIVEKKKKLNKDKLCPHCGSACITLYAIKLCPPNTYERSAECNTCFKKWVVQYDKYMISAKIIIEDK